jgi:hypothetical protein
MATCSAGRPHALSSSGVAVAVAVPASVAVSMCRSAVEVGGEAKRGCCSTRSQATRLAATGAADSAGPAIRYQAGPPSTRRLRSRVSLSLHVDFVCSWQSKHQAPASCGACTTTRLPPAPAPAPAPIKHHSLSSPLSPFTYRSPVRFGQRTERVAHLQRTKALHSH